MLPPAVAVKGSWRFRPAVMQGTATLPTLTVPAPTVEGRPAQPGARPQGAAEDRWRADGRRFAPWRYADRAIMYPSDLGLGSDAWAIPPPAVREVLHHFPAGYTAAAGADHDRHLLALRGGPVPARPAAPRHLGEYHHHGGHGRHSEPAAVGHPGRDFGACPHHAAPFGAL